MISEARRLGLDKSTRVQKHIEYGFARYLAGAVEEEIKKTIFISEDEMLAEYSNNRDIFVRPLELDVSRIVVRSAQKATEALQAVKKGMDFKDAVRKFTMESEMLLSDGRLGYTPIAEFGTFAPKLSSLQPGEVSEAIQYDATSWHIYKVWARKESTPMTFEESKPRIEEKLKLRTLRERRKQLIEETKSRNKAFVDLKYLNELYINI
jgi:parvulin-like peptidyl-prolyl isomerase